MHEGSEDKGQEHSAGAEEDGNLHSPTSALSASALGRPEIKAKRYQACRQHSEKRMRVGFQAPINPLL